MADPLLIDTVYLAALLNPKDGLHERAVALAQALAESRRLLVTTDAVLFEVANFFARSHALRRPAMAAIRRIRSAKGWAIERLTDELILRAETRYLAHQDKTWSLTDCASMEVMILRGITEAATSDHHFVQAGFQILMG